MRRFALALALCALPAAGQQDARPDQLLPATPAGWRFERIGFPLAFAPEIGAEGFEELRFAPGMFEPDSASYFSYALALSFEEDLAVGERFLEELLLAYYRGLCRAVGEDKALDFDYDSITAEVRFDGRDYLCRVELVDAFVTGQPLTLALELSVHAGARATEIFGIASALPRDAAVWSELDAIRERWRAARAVPALLNHLFLVPDPETYAALVDSKLLTRELAVSETRRTVRTDLTYEGLYLYGRHTYFEFLRPSEAFPLGQSGIAFGFEEPDGVERTAQELAGHGLTTSTREVTRALGGDQVPWLRMLGVGGPATRLSLFALEYDGRFLGRWHPEHSPAHAGIARRSVLERYAATLAPDTDLDRLLLEDVTAIHLALTSAERAHLAELCQALGYAISEEEGVLTCDGPGVTLVARDSPAPGGITGFELALSRPVEREPLELGTYRLSFEGRTAFLATGE